MYILIQTYFKYWCSFYVWVHQDCYTKLFSPPPSQRSWKIAYLSVEVYEENDQCGHVGGLEHEAAKWEPTGLHSSAESVRNGEQELDLWRRKDCVWVFAARGWALAQSDATASLVLLLQSLSVLKLSFSEPVSVMGIELKQHS